MRILSSLPRYAVGTLMIAIMALVNLEVGFRFFLNLPVAAISEIVIVLFVWVSLLGAVAAVGSNSHMALHALRNRLPFRMRGALSAFASFMMLLFGVFLLVGGYQYTVVKRTELTNVLSIPVAWEVAAFPVAGALIVVYSFAALRRALRLEPAA